MSYGEEKKAKARERDVCIRSKRPSHHLMRMSVQVDSIRSVCACACVTLLTFFQSTPHVQMGIAEKTFLIMLTFL